MAVNTDSTLRIIIMYKCLLVCLQHTIPASSPHLLVLLVCVQSISVDSVPVQPKCLIPRLKELLP